MLRSSAGARRVFPYWCSYQAPYVIRGHSVMKRTFCSSLPLSEINEKIIKLGKERNLTAAFELYEDLQHMDIQPSAKTVSLLLEACARSKETDRAFDFFFRAQSAGVRPDIHMYNALMKNCAVVGKIERGNLLLQQMNEGGIKPNLTTFHRMMQMSLHAKKPDAATVLLSTMKTFGFEPTIVSYNILIKGHLAYRDLPTAVKVFTKMQQKGITPNEDTFSLLIENSSSDQGFKFLSEMKRFQIKASLKIYNSFLTACGKEGNADRAYQVYEIMNENNVQPDRTTLNTLMAVTIKTKDFEQTTRFLEKMHELEIRPNLATYNILLARFCKLGHLDSIIDLLGEMIHSGVTPNVTSFNTVLTICVETKDKEIAAKIIGQMKQFGIEPNEVTRKHLNALESLDLEGPKLVEHINESTESEDPDRPSWKQIIETKEKQELDAREELIFLNCHKLYLINGEDSLERKKDAPAFGEEEEEKQNVYDSFFELVCLFADANEVGKSFQVVEIMRELGIQVTAEIYNQLIVGLGNIGEIGRIDQVVEIMIDERIPVEIETYNAIVTAYGLCDDFDHAIQVLDVMKGDNIEPNAESFCCLLRTCITSDSTQYGVEPTLHVMDKLENSNVTWTEELFNLVVGAYERTKNYPKALETYHSLKSSGYEPSEDGMGAILSVAAMTKDITIAREILEDAKKMPENETKDAILALIQATWNLK